MSLLKGLFIESDFETSNFEFEVSKSSIWKHTTSCDHSATRVFFLSLISRIFNDRHLTQIHRFFIYAFIEIHQLWRIVFDNYQWCPVSLSSSMKLVPDYLNGLSLSWLLYTIDVISIYTNVDWALTLAPYCKVILYSFLYGTHIRHSVTCFLEAVDIINLLLRANSNRTRCKLLIAWESSGFPVHRLLVLKKHRIPFNIASLSLSPGPSFNIQSQPTTCFNIASRETIRRVVLTFNPQTNYYSKSDTRSLYTERVFSPIQPLDRAPIWMINDIWIIGAWCFQSSHRYLTIHSSPTLSASNPLRKAKK